MLAVDVSYNTVYVPIYVGVYDYGDKRYSFLVNGYNGNTWGEKPSSMGGFGRGFMKFCTGRTTNTITIGGGAELNAADGVKFYNDKHQYLILPPADQFLMFSQYATATIMNSGKASITLRAQCRKMEDTGKTCTLGPSKALTFSYNCQWLLEIVSGDAQFIRIVTCETSGGREEDDVFGMIT